MLRLVEPDPSQADAFRNFVDDFLRRGEPDATRASKYLAGKTDFDAYVQSLRDAAHGIGLPEGQAPYRTFWLIADETLIGIVRIRPVLTPDALRTDGHIGFDIAPAERRKGYGTAMLRMALGEARRLGLDSVIVTCLATNVPSKRTIEKAGGRFIEVVTDEETGQSLLRYELACPEAGATDGAAGAVGPLGGEDAGEGSGVAAS